MFLVLEDGSLQLLPSAHVVVATARGELRISAVGERLTVSEGVEIVADGEGVLVVGPADATSMIVCLEPPRGRRSRGS